MDQANSTEKRPTRWKREVVFYLMLAAIAVGWYLVGRKQYMESVLETDATFLPYLQEHYRQHQSKEDCQRCGYAFVMTEASD